jgi:hypothetical protein
MDLNISEGDPRAAWVPEACTLPTVEQPLRVAEFDEVFANAVRDAERVGPSHLRLELDPAAGAAGRIAELAAAETGCCSFFTFTLTVANSHLVLDVTVQPAQVGVLDALAARAAQLSG